jgi:hypothetical protein
MIMLSEMPVDDASFDEKALESPQDPVVAASADLLKATDPSLNEDAALALLRSNELTADLLEKLSKNDALIKSRKVKLGIIGHPNCPRYISVSLLRKLFTFDLMAIALKPVIPGDIKAGAEELLIKRLESLSEGERIALARRASGRVVGALLLHAETRVIHAALENPRLTEAVVVKALMGAGCSAALVRSVCQHPKWSLRQDIRIALLKNGKTPLPFAEEFARAIPLPTLQQIFERSNLPAALKRRLLRKT